MRQTSDHPIASGLTAPSASTVGSLVRRLAIAGLLLAGITILATIALASHA